MNAAEPLRTPQVITFKPDGAIEGLQFKNRGLDLRAFGKAKIERTSEILWNEYSQLWEIVFLHGTCAGETATYRHAFDFQVPCIVRQEALGMVRDSCDHVIQFKEYDDAVAGEVLLIQSARLAGLGHLIAPATSP